MKKRVEKDIIKTREASSPSKGSGPSGFGEADDDTRLLELEKMLHQTEDDLLAAKKRLYFPHHYRLTHGSLDDGIFIGIEDILVEKLEASVTVEVAPMHPQIAVRLVGQTAGRGAEVAFRALPNFFRNMALYDRFTARARPSCQQRQRR